MNDERVLMSLDLGSYYVKGLIATKNDKDEIEIRGMGSYGGSLSDCGISEGIVKNVQTTVSSIEKTVGDAEGHYGNKIDEVLVGFSGRHIESRNAEGSVVVTGRDREIDDDDIQHVWEQAKTKVQPLQENRILTKAIPRWYKIDDENAKIKEPKGMSGSKLGVDMHLVLCSGQQIKNIEKCVHNAGIDLMDTVPNPIAASYAVMGEDEAELGCLVVDMGAETTDISLFMNDAICHTGVIDIGGNIVTKDIATVLRTPKNKAESLKLRYGTTFLDGTIDPSQEIEVPSVGGRSVTYITRQELYNIIRPRMEEMIKMIYDEVDRRNFQFRNLGAGVILTGGMAHLHGFDMLLADMFGVPVKIGIPTGVTGLDVARPEFAAAVGVLKYGFEHYDEYYQPKKMGEFGVSFKKVSDFMRKLFSNE